MTLEIKSENTGPTHDIILTHIRVDGPTQIWLTASEVRELVKGLLKHSDIAQDTLHDAGWRVVRDEEDGLDEVASRVTAWCKEKLDGETYHAQVAQMVEELGELCDAYKKNEPLLTEAGDVGVVWLSICHTLDLDPTDALARAHEKIADRTGRMVDGQFVKDGEDDG